MKNLKKITVMLLVISLIVGLLSSCKTNTNVVEGGKDERIVLKWLIPSGSEQKDAPKVYEEFNKLLKTYPGMENVTVEVETIEPSEYKQKFLLMQTSGNLPDIAGTYTLDYPSEVQNDTFLPLNDLVSEIAPDINKEIPSWVFDTVKVKDRFYVIPNYQMMVDFIFNFVAQGEDANKYLDKENLEKVMSRNTYFSKECYDEVEKYLKALKDNGLLHKGIATSSVYAWKGHESTNVGPYRIRWDDGKAKVVNIWETAEMKLLFDTAHDWFEKGYIRPDVLSADSAEDCGVRDGMDLWVVQAIKGVREQKIAEYGMDLTFVPWQDYYTSPNSSAAGGNGILKECKNPKTAMKFLDLMYTQKGKALYNLLVYGLEGTHYEKISEDRIKPFDYAVEVNSSSAYGLRKWVVGNTQNAFETTGNIEGYKDYVFNDLNKGSIKSKFAGCVFDTTKIQSKLLQINTIYKEFDAPLCTGALPNYEETYNEFMSKLKKAGSDDVRADLQDQVDKWLGQ